MLRARDGRGRFAWSPPCKGGGVVSVGVGGSSGLPVCHAVAGEKAFRGSATGSSVAERDVALYLRFFRAGRLPVDRLKGGTMAFAALNENRTRCTTAACSDRT